MVRTVANTERLPPALRSPWIVGALILLGLVAALVTYKVSGSLATIARVQGTHTLAPRAEWLATAAAPDAVRSLVRAVNYLAIVWPALAFGVLIGAAVRAVVPSAWIARLLGGSLSRSQLVGGLVGAPLMLCSCCVAPIFAAVQERTKRAGPAGALMLAAPSLNPAALALTFMLFATEMALTRVVMAVVLVFGVSALAARHLPRPEESAFAACALESEGPQGPLEALSAFAREAGRLARTTLPLIVGGVLLSSVLLDLLPADRLREVPFRIATVLLVALVSVPLALPTFAEIPLALGLLAAGAPPGAAVALMIAGPAINLPSLLTVARTTTPLHSAALAAGAFLAAVAGGLIV
jgi:uncharacterized membrane protein YraQ (UPF0718 family)